MLRYVTFCISEEVFNEVGFGVPNITIGEFEDFKPIVNLLHSLTSSHVSVSTTNFPDTVQTLTQTGRHGFGQDL